MIKEPCKCGALDCPVCGRAQGTYDAYTTLCGKCNEVLNDCDCDEPEPMEEEEDDWGFYDEMRENWESDRAADTYERNMERGR